MMDPQPATFALLNARQVVTCAGPAPRSGSAQGDAGCIEGGALACFEDRVVYAGPAATLAAAVAGTPQARFIDLHGRYSIVPGFVDGHTHAAYAGDRRAELRRRLAGASYAEIAAAGGGIVSTVAATRAASEAALVESTRARLDEMLACGTTTCEIKSGYGLTTAAEVKMLRAIRTLARTHPLSIISTFMGAHEVPIEYRSARDRYVDLIVDEMLLAVAGESLAEWCDVFCEEGVFTPDESRAILQAGQRHGLKARIHADELALSGGSRVAAEVGARSADHLIYVDETHARMLAEHNVVATLLPSAAFFLKLGRYAPARMLIEQGAAVALATDLNPGGGFTTSMPFVMSLACFGMNMTLVESLVAATQNAAWSLDRHDCVGSLEPGK